MAFVLNKIHKSVNIRFLDAKKNNICEKTLHLHPEFKQNLKSLLFGI